MDVKVNNLSQGNDKETTTGNVLNLNYSTGFCYSLQPITF